MTGQAGGAVAAGSGAATTRLAPANTKGKAPDSEMVWVSVSRHPTRVLDLGARSRSCGSLLPPYVHVAYMWHRAGCSCTTHALLMHPLHDILYHLHLMRMGD